MSPHPFCAQCAACPYDEDCDSEVWCPACQLCRRCCRRNADDSCRNAWEDDDQQVSWDIQHRSSEPVASNTSEFAPDEDYREAAGERNTHETLRGTVATIPFRFMSSWGAAVFFGFDSVVAFDGGRPRVEPYPVLLLGDERRMLLSDLRLGDELVLWGKQGLRAVRTSPSTPPVELNVFEATQCMPWFTSTLERWEAWEESEEEFLYPDEPSGNK